MMRPPTNSAQRAKAMRRRSWTAEDSDANIYRLPQDSVAPVDSQQSELTARQRATLRSNSRNNSNFNGNIGLAQRQSRSPPPAVNAGEHALALSRLQQWQDAHDALLEQLGKAPLLALGMRLGEASGATLAIAILRGALACHSGMATFAEAGVSDS